MGLFKQWAIIPYNLYVWKHIIARNNDIGKIGKIKKFDSNTGQILILSNVPFYPETHTPN